MPNDAPDLDELRRQIDAIDADPGAAERGTVIHDTLEAFFKEYPDELPNDAENLLIAVGEKEFAKHMAQPGVRAFWWPRFLQVAAWDMRQQCIYWKKVLN